MSMCGICKTQKEADSKMLGGACYICIGGWGGKPVSPPKKGPAKEIKCPACLKWGMFEAICPQCLADARLGRMARARMDALMEKMGQARDGEVGLSDAEQDELTYLAALETEKKV